MEQWKTIEGFEAYEVSDLGRVRRRLPGKRIKAGGFLKPNRLRKGYLIVRLYKGKGNDFGDVLVHVLVAKAFIPNPLSLPQVNHLGANDDPRASQLEWRSEQGNMLHASKTGRKGLGVCYNKKDNKWWAYYTHANVRVHIGRYATKKEALAVRKTAMDAIPEVL